MLVDELATNVMLVTISKPENSCTQHFAKKSVYYVCNSTGVCVCVNNIIGLLVHGCVIYFG